MTAAEMPTRPVDMLAFVVQVFVAGSYSSTVLSPEPGGLITPGVTAIRLEARDLDGGFLENRSSTFLNTVPVPAALPLFASALGLLGFMGWRRGKTA